MKSVINFEFHKQILFKNIATINFSITDMDHCPSSLHTDDATYILFNIK